MAEDCHNIFLVVSKIMAGYRALKLEFYFKNFRIISDSEFSYVPVYRTIYNELVVIIKRIILISN